MPIDVHRAQISIMPILWTLLRHTVATSMSGSSPPITFMLKGKVQPFCCCLRPNPSDLEINLYIQSVEEALNMLLNIIGIICIAIAMIVNM